MSMKVLISGSSGRMGTALKNVISEDSAVEWTYGFSSSAQGDKEVSNLTDIDPAQVDLVIDFSLPDSFKVIYEWCEQNNKPLLSGTTGFSISDYTSNLEMPFMHSGNYSMGIALLKESVAQFGKLKDAKIWIEDVHHSKKLDAPSGTALLLKEAMLTRGGPGKEIEIQSVRGGSVFGVHKVHAVTDSEWLTFSHQALNREVFARGAVEASKWLMNQPSGFYSFGDYFKS